MSGFISKRKMGRDKMGPWGNELSDVLQSPISDDWGLHKARNWKLKLCVTPVSYTHLTLPTIYSV